jgi:hypothetical protein
MSTSTTLLACATLSLTAGCTRDDPVSVLEVTTTVTPTVASIARDTAGVLITVRVHNPLPRAARIRIRPGRYLRANPDIGFYNDSTGMSWGIGPAVHITGVDSAHADYSNLVPVGLPGPGRFVAFDSGATSDFTVALSIVAIEVDGRPDLAPGRYLLTGRYGSNQSGSIELVVTP